MDEYNGDHLNTQCTHVASFKELYCAATNLIQASRSMYVINFREYTFCVFRPILSFSKERD